MSAALPFMRSQYGIPQDVTYFNCAYLSPLHKRVEEACLKGMNRKARPWEIKPHHFFDESDELRGQFGLLANCPSGSVALVPSVSYAIGIAAANLPLEAGQHVLVLAEQFPSNFYPWKVKADEVGAGMRIVPRPQDGNWTAAILNHMDQKTAIVALPNCHWTDGTLVDLVTISEACHRGNIPLVLDVTQSMGAMPLDIERIKPAYLVSAGYKWMQGPYGLSYFYVAPEYQNGKPLEYNWITRADSENFARLVDYVDELSPGASRFDMGERSNTLLHPMGLAAISLLLEWDVHRLADTLEAYNQRLIEACAELGFTVAPKAYRSPHLLGLRFPGKLPSTLAGELAEKNIYVSVRGDAIRVSPHLYNDDNDLDRFLEALKASL